MQLFFIFLTVIFSPYFLFKKRQFDFFSLAFISAIIYFLPGFFGYVLYPNQFGLNTVPTPIIDSTYIVMILVISGIFIGAVVYDNFFPKKKFKSLYIKGSSYSLLIFLSVGILGFLLTLSVVGDDFFTGNKTSHMRHYHNMRWQLLWAVGASLSMVISFFRRKWIYFAIASLLMIFNVYIGHRSYFAFTVIAIGVIWLFDRGKKPLLTKKFCLKYWWQILLFTGLAYFFFLYKSIYRYVLLGEWTIIGSKLSEPSFYLSAITNSEPFVTQSILNEVLRQNFQLGLDHVLFNVINQLLIFSSLLNVPDFNARFQRELFPTRDAGLAANIWAEMWSSGGWILLILFIIVFVVFLGIGSRLLFYQNITFKSGVSLIFSCWAFYIHRNGIHNQLSFEKQFILLLVFGLLLPRLLPIKKRNNNINKIQNYYDV